VEPLPAVDVYFDRHRPAVSFVTAAGRVSSSILRAHALARLPLRFEPLDGELIGDVIFIDVVDVLDGLEPHDFGRSQLDVSKPDVRIEARLFSEGAKLLQALRPGIVKDKAHQRAILRVERRIGEKSVGKISRMGAAGVDISVRVLVDPGDSDGFTSCGRGLDLHEARRPCRAAARLVEP